jgi:SAM-dependent methyltransferase
LSAAPAAPNMPGDWTHGYFGETYGLLYRRHLLTPERSRHEAQFAAGVLGPAPGALLDVGAGFGRHARHIARNRKVVALDFNAAYLALARRGLKGAAARNLAPAQADMRALPFAPASFGAAMMLFNSFGYFSRPAEAMGDARQRQIWRLPQVFYERELVDRDHGVFPATGGAQPPPRSTPSPGTSPPETDPNLAVLHEVHRVLVPGGLFLIEVANPGPLIRAVREAPRRHVATSAYSIQEEFTYDETTRILSNRTRWSAGGNSEEAGYHLRLYTRAELAAALRACGMSLRAVWGGYNGEAYSARESDVILCLAQRARVRKDQR